MENMHLKYGVRISIIILILTGTNVINKISLGFVF